jgi:hypothetical protein
MEERRQFGRRGALLLIGLTAACVLLAGVAALLAPPRLASHYDQVAYALRRHNIAYEQIKLTQTRQDTQDYTAYADYSIYGADVSVRLPNGRQEPGRIECHVRDSRCRLYLMGLGLPPEDLPDLDTGTQWFWLDWLQQILPRLGLASHVQLS